MRKLRRSAKSVSPLTIISIAVIVFGFLYLTWQMGRSFGNSEVVCTVEIIGPAIPMPQPGTVLGASH